MQTTIPIENKSYRNSLILHILVANSQSIENVLYYIRNEGEIMKKLYKIKSKGKLAEYSNIDVSIIRLFWCILSVTNVMGPVLYLICHFVLPEKDEEHFF